MTGYSVFYGAAKDYIKHYSMKLPSQGLHSKTARDHHTGKLELEGATEQCYLVFTRTFETSMWVDKNKRNVVTTLNV